MKSPLAAFLHTLLRDGRAVLRDRPLPVTVPDAEAAEVVRRAHADHCLDLPGPPLELDLDLALEAAVLVQRACWFLVSVAEPEIELAKTLVMPRLPRSPADHWSADLLLRFLPAIHRRARALDPADCLPGVLAGVLRRWPFSGVLSDVAEGPLAPVTFDGHPGLLLLYAERLSRAEKVAWVPRGSGTPFVELVWSELGKDALALLRSAAEDVGDE